MSIALFIDVPQPGSLRLWREYPAFDAGQRHVECIKIDDRYEFIGLFVASWRFPRHQTVRDFKAPSIWVFVHPQGPIPENG
jgi:hypothetical protein